MASATRPEHKVIHTELENGAAVCIREITPDDEERMREGITRMSPRSLYMRFFTGLRTPPDWVIDNLLDVDGHRHIAWGAIDVEAPGEPAIGAVHAMREALRSESAEFSVAIVDSHHRLGLGKLLTATILLDAASEGLSEFSCNVLAENRQAGEFVRLLGGRIVSQDGATLEFRLDIAGAIDALRTQCDPPGIAKVFAAFPAAAAIQPQSGTPPAP